MPSLNDRRDGITEGLAYKRPARVATTANVTLSGLQVIDTITLVESDRVLVKENTDPTENGIYNASSGFWTRAKDFDGSNDVIDGTQVYVTEGVVNVDKEFVVYLDTDPADFGTTEFTFVEKREQADEKYTGNSTTSRSISTGSKTFTIEAGKAFVADEWVLIFSKADAGNNLYGQITDYTGSTLTVNVIAITGSGTFADWTIVLSGAEQTKGRQPPVGVGDASGPGSSVAGNIASFTDTTGKLLADSGVEAVKANQAQAEAGTSTSVLMNPARTNDAIKALTPTAGVDILNGYIVASVSASAITLALKTTAGTDPSASDPVKIAFRNATVTNGVGVVRSVTAALSLVIPQGATLGFASSEVDVIYAAFLDNAGTVELAVVKDGSLITEDRNVSSTTIGTGSDSATVIYSATGRSNVSCRLAAVIVIQTDSTAGDWTNAPTRVTNVSHGLYPPNKNTIRCSVVYNTTTSTSITDSFNVSSLTDNGTGETTINFAVVQPDAKYAVAAFVNGTNIVNGNTGTPAAPSASSFDINTSTAVPALADAGYVSGIVVGR
jgi:hypothetical protein